MIAIGKHVFPSLRVTCVSSSPVHASFPARCNCRRLGYLQQSKGRCQYLTLTRLTAEPVSRCEYINEYEMTQHSLHAAVSIGLDSGLCPLLLLLRNPPASFPSSISLLSLLYSFRIIPACPLSPCQSLFWPSPHVRYMTKSRIL